MIKKLMILVGTILGLGSCARSQEHAVKAMNVNSNMENTQNANATDTATFGQGCFWCAEAIFQDLKGVISAKSGYSGGQVANPTYEQVCTGNTGHAEVIHVVYAPKVIKYEDLLQAFWSSHDPTTLNRQGNDVGTQYRSVVFYHNEHQRELAEKYKKELDESGAYTGKIVTQIVPFEQFYVAEDYHQLYYKMNGSAPYCQFVIKPKVDKFRKVFQDKLKTVHDK